MNFNVKNFSTVSGGTFFHSFLACWSFLLLIQSNLLIFQMHILYILSNFQWNLTFVTCISDGLLGMQSFELILQNFTWTQTELVIMTNARAPVSAWANQKWDPSSFVLFVATFKAPSTVESNLLLTTDCNKENQTPELMSCISSSKIYFYLFVYILQQTKLQKTLADWKTAA